MKKIWCLILIFAAFQAVASDSLLLQMDWEQREVPVYEMHESYAGQTALAMGYASHTITNPRIWTNDIRKKYIYEVDIVLSKYPKHKTAWVTNYDTLMRKRVKELFALVPELEQNKNISWNIVLQTDCDTEDEAKEMFHGAVIKYKLHLTSKLRKTLHSVRNIINGRENFEDSVVFKVFDRHEDWKNMLVVNDWTGSMYQYGAQSVLWHRLNLRKSDSLANVAIQHFVFFNDGNLLPDDEKEIGATGGVYYTQSNSVRQIGNTMREVMLSGYGGDKPENDLEAVLYGMEKAGDFDEIVLIADNSSPVRDIELLSQIGKPIKIILCGTSRTKGIHPHYLEIARKTKGSVHTITDDILNLANKKSGETFEVSGQTYQLIDEHFIMVEE